MEIIKKRKFKFGIYSAGSILAIAGIIVIVNYLSFHIFKRFDLTGGHIYSLSKASKKIVRSLDDPVLVKCYFTKKLPSPYNIQSKYLNDLLVEYRAYSRGKLKFEFIDPSSDEELRKEAMSSGVHPITFTQIESDKYEVKEGFMGMIFLYADRKEIIPFIKEVSGLEYAITSRIKKITASGTKTVGFLKGHDEQDLFGNSPRFEAMVARDYAIKDVNLKETGNEISPDIDSILIIGPVNPIPENELYAIDRFLMGGKTLAFFVDNTDVDTQRFTGQPSLNNLCPVLQHYGIRVNPGLVLDPQCQTVGLESRSCMFTMKNFINYPFLPILTSFAQDSPIVKGLERITFPFVSPLEIVVQEDAATGKPLLTAEVIASTSEKSWYEEKVFSFHPMVRYAPREKDKKGPFAAAAVLIGRFDSYFTSRKIPAGIQPGQEKPTQSLPSRMIVVGTSKFIQPGFVEPSNIVFFMNILDWLVQDESLISIRGKGITYRPLKEISKNAKVAMKYTDIFLMPLVMVIVGIVRWRRRESQKKKAALAL